MLKFDLSETIGKLSSKTNFSICLQISYSNLGLKLYERHYSYENSQKIKFKRL